MKVIKIGDSPNIVRTKAEQYGNALGSSAIGPEECT